MNRILLVIYFSFLLQTIGLGQPAGNPADAFASVKVSGDSVTLIYKHRVIATAVILSHGNPYHITRKQERLDNKLFQTFIITPDKGKDIEFVANIYASAESFPCEAEQPEGLRIVRHVVGLSRSLLNHAVYDRQLDWLLSVDRQTASVLVNPDSAAPASNHFSLKASGREITVRFLPLYYQQHRQLHYFQPEKYSIWKRPVVGWCSWFAYFDNIDEVKIKHTADEIADKLKDFGLEYIQIDDGYQQTPIGLPDTWLHANNKFPGGLASLAAYIKSKGLVPAIWTNVAFADSAAAFKNKELFVTDKSGHPAYGSWVGYSMDGANHRAIDRLITPVYTGLKKMGWQYFKLDALRHLRYEGYNSNDSYFKEKKEDKIFAFRNVVSNVRKAIGRENFLLACWGIRPELVGLVDGCRIGNDGYSYAGLAQFNSYNNVIWRNDPDHIELSAKEAYRSCVATSLTGSLFMLTDKPEKYEDTALLEAARRSIPVLFTTPAQVYDVDPSRSSGIEKATIEMSGSGPRSFDASTSTTTGLFLQEIARPFEDWTILGRLDDRDRTIPLKDLGLDGKSEYLVFEFWTKSFRGVVTNALVPGEIDTAYHCQVFCLRKRLSRPQLLATNRHISCGGLEIKDLQWKQQSLIGTSEIVANDPYIIYVHEPPEFTFKKFICNGAKLVGNIKNGSVRTITVLGKTAQTINWEIEY